MRASENFPLLSRRMAHLVGGTGQAPIARGGLDQFHCRLL